MKVSVVSFVGSGRARYGGVYSIFSSLEKAVIAIRHYCENNNESIYDYDNDITTWRFFTTQGTYVIERMELNEE